MKIDKDLVQQVKKAPKIKGISMSNYIRDRLESEFRPNSQVQESGILKWFGKLQYDSDIAQIEQNIEENRSNYKHRKAEL